MNVENILKQKVFHTEPVDFLINQYNFDNERPTKRDAEGVNLSNYVLRDMIFRFKHAGDMSLNIQGLGNKGKSNMLLWYSDKWCGITGQTWDLSNIVYNLPEYNMLLKGIKVRQVDEMNIKLERFDLNPGIALCLDEAGDRNIAGMLSLSTVMMTEDMEKRMRVKQIGRFCAGVGEILRTAYYCIWAYERDEENVNEETGQKEPICRGLVFANPTGKVNDQIWLGRVDVPYVRREVFNAYQTPKVKSVEDYSFSIGAGRIGQILNFFSKELWENAEFQILPLKPVARRINWLMSNPRYRIWPTQKYYEELEKLSRNKELCMKLNGQAHLGGWARMEEADDE